MFGPPNVENCLVDGLQQGIMPRACDALFKKLCTRAAEKGENFTYEVSCRFVELYNEEFYDLLSRTQQKLSIRSDSKGVYLLGVSEHKVLSAIDMMRILEIGWDARRTAETEMNRESSRSHSIFTVDVKTEELVNTIVNKKCATLNLVDLAGSERQTQAKTFGDRFREAVNINLSLTVLGRVIRTLSDVNRRDDHVPYRDSKLTHFLRDSLGGNSRTAVIVNIHPDKGYYSDSLSTLQFAAECRKIENRVCANEDLTGDTVMAYKSEITRLREEIRLNEEKIRAEMNSKMEAIGEELKEWKETAISREKELLKAQIQCDLFFAQLMNKTNQDSNSQSHDELMRDISSQLCKRIDSVRTFEDFTKVQLENDLSNARSQLDQLRIRCESAEAARRDLNEKYNNILQECNDSFLGTPLRRLNLNTPRGHHEMVKTPAQRKKERRQTLFTPASENRDRASRAFRPVLFEENDDGDQQRQGDIEQDKDMIEERELLRLEIDNNRLSQIIAEKEAAIKDICDKQKSQSKQWIEEKKLLIETESSLNARIEVLEREKSSLLENLKESQQQAQLLGANLSSCNDEKCRLEQSVESLRTEKLDLEDRLQVMQNENERLLAELEGLPELVSDACVAFTVIRGGLPIYQVSAAMLADSFVEIGGSAYVLFLRILELFFMNPLEQTFSCGNNISELRLQLNAALENNSNLQVRNEAVEKECNSHLVALRSKEEDIHQIVAAPPQSGT
ncbi:microtubule motor activity protein [Parelaphostrongylus tenuis]|uniref:Kinesin-like protein n=1 Tax=Parelaphostrongylus tenuis TaxID=148309 RepID=A0AAD5WLI2_PARTN|nr:microtubule motor activity protein [Parelaphostrongylus tenuis]